MKVQRARRPRGHCVSRIQRVHKVQKVQRVVVAPGSRSAAQVQRVRPARGGLVQRVQRVMVAARPQIYIRRRRHTILPSEPARSVGGTGGLQGVQPRRGLEPGRRRRLNPLAFGNTVQPTAGSRQPSYSPMSSFRYSATFRMSSGVVRQQPQMRRAPAFCQIFTKSA